MKTTKAQIINIICELFNTSLQNTAHPIDFGKDYTRTRHTVHIATKHVSASLSFFNDLYLHFSDYKMTVFDIEVSPMPALDNRLSYTITFNQETIITD